MAIKDDPRIVEFITQVELAIDNEKDFLAKGRCSDHEHYCGVVGKIKGMETSLLLLLDVLKNYGKEDDDEDL